MWLLNTSTRQLESFPDDRGVSYAILSHRWLAGEVLFEDVRAVTSASSDKAGWVKLARTCAQARIDGYRWVWIDTCCINKSSSAELSEAINSMYRWYQNAAVCYAYMNDVMHGPGLEMASALDHSVWFTRGWTLQELIAPKRVEFYSSNWKRLGTREDLQPTLTRITGIPGDLLAGTIPIEEYSVAQRMSWAAHRKTTRVEDVAYSLMGLFGVNMPMLYGEGEAAFLRLQEEIMKDSADETMFAWKYRNPSEYHDLLARSPADFADCGQMQRPAEGIHREYYQKTNRGLRITLFVRHHATDVYHAALDCVEIGADGLAKRTGIFLGCPVMAVDTTSCARRLVTGQDRLTFKTQESAGDPDLDGGSFPLSFMIPPRPFPHQRVRDLHYGFVLSGFDIGDNLSLGRGVFAVARPGTWDPALGILTLPPGTNGAAMCFAVIESSTSVPWPIAKLGFSRAFTPVFHLESMDWLFNHRRGPNIEDLVLDNDFAVISEGPLQKIPSSVQSGGSREPSVEAILAERLSPSARPGRFQADHRNGLTIQTESLYLNIAIDYHRRLGLAWHVQVKVSQPAIKRNP